METRIEFPEDDLYLYQGLPDSGHLPLQIPYISTCLEDVAFLALLGHAHCSHTPKYLHFTEKIAPLVRAPVRGL